jgi:hypothetical protein
MEHLQFKSLEPLSGKDIDALNMFNIYNIHKPLINGSSVTGPNSCCHIYNNVLWRGNLLRVVGYIVNSASEETSTILMSILKLEASTYSEIFGTVNENTRLLYPKNINPKN